MLPALPPASVLDQPVALEDVEDGAPARQLGRVELLLEQSVKFASAPAVRPLQQHDLALNVGRCSVRARLWRPTTFLETTLAKLSVAARPFVTGRAGHAVVLAELRHRPLPRGQVTHELSPLLHGARLFPW